MNPSKDPQTLAEPSTSSGLRTQAVPKILISERNKGATALKNIHLEVPTSSSVVQQQETPTDIPARPKSNLSNMTTMSSSSNTSSSLLEPKPANNSDVASISVSPRSKPRLSFDEMSIQRQEEWRRQSGDSRNQGGGGIGRISTISDKVPQSDSVSVNELTRKSSMRRHSNLSTPGNANHVSHEPSIKSAPSHPSLQDDACSEIVRLDNGTETRNNSISLQNKAQQLRTFVNVFRVHFHPCVKHIHVIWLQLTS